MKKLLSIITAMVMIFCLMPPVRSFAADTETVGYIAYVSDGNGGYKAQTKTAECTVIDSANIISSLTNGQYAVKGDVTVSDRIKISGDVQLILTDGCTLNAQKGINLPESSTLSICGQSGGTGRLNANSDNDTAIGGENEETCGTLNVYGGDVSAASDSGAAIGGGFSASNNGGNGGTVEIYGGKVSATSTDGAAIGGGNSTDGTGGDGSTVNVYGGEVIAESYNVAAIGGGVNANGVSGSVGQTFISGGSVRAYSGKAAFDHVPTFGAGYIPKVTYGEYGTSTTSAVNPADSVYTSNKYISIKNAPNAYANVDYITNTWDGQKIVQGNDTAKCLMLGDDYKPSELTGGWYALGEDVTITDRIKISGDVQLILTDGLTLNAKRGINLPENSTLSIYGQSGGTGKLNAKSGNKTAIGGENEENCGTLNVYGGQVSAVSPGTAIGGGNSASKTAGNGGTVNVYGGQVSAESSETAIGGGGSTDGTGGNGGTVNVYGGMVNALSDSETAIGGGFSTSGTGGTGSDLTVYGGEVSAKSSSFTAIGGGRTTSGKVGNSGQTFISGGSVSAYSKDKIAFDHAPTYGTNYLPKVSYGESDTSTVSEINPDNSVYTSNKYVSIEKADLTADYQYCSRSWNGSSVVSSTQTANCTTLDNTNFPTALSDGWYAVKGDVTVSDRITISGNVQLILTDGCTLNAKNGINLPESSTLSIYGQSGGTGKLNAEYDGDTAIGGEYGESCGTLNVYGGTVNANSTNEAAIGGGDSIDGTSGNGGTVNVYGGTVNAVSDSGAAIGGGDSATGTGGNGGTVNVYGGKLTAGSSNSVAIGGGSSATGPAGNGGTVNVYGGTVDANSANDTAIGGGCSATGTGGNGGTVNVYGGKLNAVSSSRAAIGGGLGANRTPGSVGQTFISGGSVSAYSGRDNVAAFDHAPTYGTNYIPKVTYGESDTSTVTKINPDNSVYTSNKYVLIEKSNDDHEHCGHSANTNPTCEGANCSVCGEYIDPTGHKNGDPVIENETEAVCEIGGSYDEVIYCSVCGKELSRETKTVEAKGHIPAEPVIENQTAAVCTEGGSYDEVVYCSVCKKELSRVTRTTEALGHIEGEWEVISAPTTTSVGTKAIKCKVCGEILKTETIPQVIINIPQIPANIPTEKPSEVVYTEFPELKYSVEIKDGKAIISWDKVENVNKYVVYAIRDGKLTELEKTKKTEFETKHTSGTGYLVRYMKNGVLSPRAKSMNEDITSDKPIVSASAGKDFIRLDWQDMGAEKYNIYKYADGKAIKIGEVKKTAVKIINLSPDTEYKFIVTSVIDGKETTMLMRDILTVRTKKA